jgi:prepilin-type N-terminal cleavage/methylation domain-containing protein
VINQHHKGFTIIEIIIAAGILSLFMTGLFSLYRGGSNLSNATLWTQHTINQLKLACRELNNSIKKSTYPTSITFPGSIAENTSNDFALHYFSGTICATQTTGIAGSGFNGAKILSLTESTPAKIGFAATENTDAVIVYHVFALDSDNRLNYSRWREQVAGDQITALTRPATPPGSATGVYQTVLARDVEFITCEPVSPANPRSPLSIRINCRIPRGNTTRSEQAVGTPNVSLVAHNTIGGW